MRHPFRAIVTAAAIAALTACASAPPGDQVTPSEDVTASDGVTTQDSVIVQGGAPGESSRPLTAEEAEALPTVSHTPADVEFVTDMLYHHAQALQMTALVSKNSNSEQLAQFSERMDISQADEIARMEEWLEKRGEPIPGIAPDSPEEHLAQDHDHQMPGMLTPEQMDRLRKAKGAAFDALFLRFMTQHHEGALTMVRELLEREDGSGQEQDIWLLVSHIEADQAIELARMEQMAAGALSDEG